jgi:hypothetical protein
LFIAILVSALLPSRPGIAGFPSTETFLPAVGRIAGQGGAQFYTTIWATNLTSAPVSFTFDFLKQGQANTSPVSFADTLAPGETKVYENVIESKFGIASAIGAARIVANGEILVSERIYNQPLGADVGNTEGLFFAGVPKSFSISLGQSASIQGINQEGAGNFRYNFALVETGGGSPTVNVQLFDGNGTLLGHRAYALQPYEQIQPNVADITASVHTTNARITATVTAGMGSVLLAGAQLANESQDSSGFEMSFRDDLLGGGAAGVTSLNSLIGSVSLIAGTNVTLTTVGNGIKIDAAGGSGGGAGVSSLNSLKGALSITPGNGISVSESGSSIQVAYTGGGLSGLTTVTHDTTLTGDGTGAHSLGLTLPFFQSIDPGYAPLFEIDNKNALANLQFGAIKGVGVGGFGIRGESQSVAGVMGESQGQVGVFGHTFAAGSSGVYGLHESSGNYGELGAASFGVFGFAKGGGIAGVLGQHDDHAGNFAGVEGEDVSSGLIGYLGGQNYGVFSHGDVKSDGGKSFVEPHPIDPSKEINYMSLEGPESGTYCRGASRIIGGFATIVVPEDFRMVTAEKGLTVQLTPVGDFATLVVKSYGLDRIVVEGSRDVEFFYLVNGVRKALEDHRPIVENTDFIPRSPSDAAYWKGLPPESLRRMKANGTLNPDGSINLETAHRLGWDRKPEWNAPPAAALENEIRK